MLIVSGIAQYKQEELDLDSFVIYLRWYGVSPIPVYWRTGDSSKDLFEIGLEPGSGTVQKIKLVIVEDVSDLPLNYLSIRDRDIPQQRGVPVCDIAWWPSGAYYFDEPGSLVLRIGNHSVSIEMGTDIKVTSCIIADRVSFGIDASGILRIIEIQDLSSEEIGMINRLFRKKNT